MFKSRLDLFTNDPVAVWMGRIVFLLMLATLMVVSRGLEVDVKVMMFLRFVGCLTVLVWILERLIRVKQIGAAHRIFRRLGRLADRDYQIKCAIRQVLTDSIAEEILAVERVNPSRARQLRAEFKKLHQDGQTLGLIPEGEKWDEYFTRSTGGPRTKEEQSSLNERGDGTDSWV